MGIIQLSAGGAGYASYPQQGVAMRDYGLCITIARRIEGRTDGLTPSNT